jgi:hypothetical protein
MASDTALARQLLMAGRRRRRRGSHGGVGIAIGGSDKKGHADDGMTRRERQYSVCGLVYGASWYRHRSWHRLRGERQEFIVDGRRVWAYHTHLGDAAGANGLIAVHAFFLLGVWARN